MAIEGGVFTNLKLNGMVIRSLPLFLIRESQILTTMNLKLSQNKGKIVRSNVQSKGKN